MSVNFTEYYVQLVDSRTKRPINDDTGLYNVLTADDPTEATVYSDDSGTSGSNPGTMTDGVIRFFTASSVTSVDLSILTASGQAYFIAGLTPSQHRVDVDPDSTKPSVLILPYNMNTACDTLVDTGFNVLANMKVKDVYVHTTTESTGNGLYIGVSGTTAGFLSIVSTTATGWKVHQAPIYTNATGSANYVSSAQIRGSLLSEWTAGLVTASAGGAKGYWARKDYLPAAATSILYMVANTNSGGTGEGYIYIEYELIPTAGN